MGAPEHGTVDFELKERAMDEAPIGITLSDPDQPDNPLIYANRSFERVTGYRIEEVLGRNCRFLQGEETDPEAVAELREGIESAEPVTVELRNYGPDGEQFWNEVTVAPLVEDGAVTNFVGFQVDVTRRKEAQIALAEERERLDRLVDRINGLLADVTELLIQGVDRAETERAIVERIAATDAYSAAWIGTPDLARDVLEPSATAGFDATLEDFAPDLAGEGPVTTAYADGTVEVADAATVPAFAAAGLTGDLAAIPLVYGDATYGVLAVVGARTDALDDRELVVLESVGRTIATAINAARSRRGLTADDLVELEFTVADPTFFPVALAKAWSCRIERRGSAASGEGGLRLFVDAVDGTVDPATTVAEVGSITTVGDEGSPLVELELLPGSVFERLADRGGEVTRLVAHGDHAELDLRVPAETGGRVVLELLEERYDGVELVAYRERERRPRTRSTVLSDLEARLTDRQSTALHSAFFGGYYDDPRRTSGDELAEAMGVSRPTFHQHLRAAERKLLGVVLEGPGSAAN